jgi:flagellar hook-associated protein 2
MTIWEDVMSGITFGGLSSGLDTASIIQQLVALRRQPIVNLQSRISDMELQKTAYSDLENKMKALMEAAQGLDSVQEFASLSAVSGNEDFMTATAGSAASAGTYDITINNLATAQKDMSQGFDNPTDSVGTGTFTITVGGEPTTIDFAGGGSLANLKDAINESGAGVTATILYDGSSTGGYHLVTTAEETGTDAAYTMDFSGLSGGTDVMLSSVALASNAELVIDTLTVSSQTNSIASAIEGVTMDLHEADIATTFSLDIAVDGEAVKDKVSGFVDAYNDLYTYIDSQRAEGATLRGDSLIRTITSRVGRIMTTRLGSGDITMLAQVGIKQTDDNLLTFEEADFMSAISEDYSGVRDLFTQEGANTGTVYLLGEAIDQMTDSVDGMFKIRTDAIDDRVDNYEDKILRLESSVESYELMQRAKFTAMEQLLSSLQSQGSALGSMGIYT